MKKIRTITAVGLIFTMLCGSVTAFANVKDNNKEDICLEYMDHGVYRLLDLNEGINTINSNSEIVRAIDTGDGEIYYLNSNKYAIRIDDETFLLTDKTELDTENYENNQIFLDEHEISDKLKEDIENAINKQKELGNNDFGVAIYTPSKLSERGSSTSTSYYYRGNDYFRDIIVKYSNCSTGMVEKNGSKAKDTASAFFNFILSTTGMASLTVSAFSAGLSALDVFESIYGKVEYGTNSDRIYTNVIYDKLEKQTDKQFNSEWYEIGCISYKVDLIRNETYQFYSASGNSYLKRYSLDESYFSESYKNAAGVVIDNFPTPVFDNDIRIKIYDTRVVL